MLTNFNYLLKDAIRKDYGIGIVEVWDLFTIKAAVEAAVEESSPAALLAGQNFIEQIGIKQFADLAISYISETDVPIALCLDECQDFNFIVKCIKSGFSFVMHEGSGGEYAGSIKLSFDENVELTREIVKVAHAVGVTVEASLGEMPLSTKGMVENLSIKGGYTDPDQAREFVDKTDIDILAPSIGNIHCLYKEKWPEPDWQLAREIVKKTGIVCSLHGASGATDEQIRKAISIGFRKVNIGTRYNEIYRIALTEEIQKCEGLGCPFNSGNAARDSVKKEAKRLMRDVFKSSGRFEAKKQKYWFIEKLIAAPSENKIINNYQGIVDEITEKIIKQLKL